MPNMLGWLSGSHPGGSTDDSKVFDPPETPAPVFAVRAFKTALFGTPKLDEDDQDGVQSVRRDAKGSPRKKNGPHTEYDSRRLGNAADHVVDVEKRQAMPSPSKSILLTPGTTALRRKTVTFGEGVRENEKKPNGAPQSKSGLPQDFPGKFPSPWTVKKSESQAEKDLLSRPPRSDEETCTTKKPLGGQLLDARESGGPSDGMISKDADVTVDVVDPKSESGRYWKSEYQQYEANTNREIKKLLQYRHAAKSYAKKKDEEASRLMEKLKQEEAKVARMERKVTEMVAKMAQGSDQNSSSMDSEGLVKRLAKQTALTLQHKQKVDRLRQDIENHDLLGDNEDGGLSSDSVSQKLLQTQKELESAQEKITQLAAENGELKKLQDLAKLTESKASTLARENESLKISLSRVKGEMSRFEERRRVKDDRLKQRESGLQTRNKEHGTDIEKLKEDREKSETKLREEFKKEKERLLAEIHDLKYSGQRNKTIDTVPINDLDSLKTRYGNTHRKPSDGKRATGESPIDVWVAKEDDEELLNVDGQDVMLGSTSTKRTLSFNMAYGGSIKKDPLQIPSSSPRIISSADPSPSVLGTHGSMIGARRATYSPRPTFVHVSSSSHHPQPRRAVTTGTRGDGNNVKNSATNRVGSGERTALPADRAAAARARLEARKAQKRQREQGKENVDQGVNSDM